MRVVTRIRNEVRRLVADVERGEEGSPVAEAPAVPVRELYRRFWAQAKPYRRWLPLILLLVALGPAIEAATIWMYKVLVDEVLVPQRFDLLLWVMLAYVGLTLAEGIVAFCDEYLTEWVGGRFIVSLRTRRPGQTLALVGPSGAGKSTITKLLLRFYDPDAGAIRLDGHDLRDLTLRSPLDNVAILLQETLVFDGTVRQNIAYGRSGATEEEIVVAAKAADAHEFILSLTDGYDTVVGQKGRLPSGGERQRIAIARAMVKDAPVLVLDEPTAGLDVESGEKVPDPLRRLMSGRTSILISHDLMTVRSATEIILLENGRVAERCSHTDLLEREGLYARLHGVHHTATRSRYEH